IFHPLWEKHIFIYSHKKYRAMKRSFLFFVLITLFSLQLQAETLKYQIKAFGIKAGTLEIKHTVVNGVDHYEIESHNEVNYLVGKIKVHHITKSTFINGI